MFNTIKNYVKLGILTLSVLLFVLILPSTGQAESYTLNVYAKTYVGGTLVNLDWSGTYDSNTQFKVQIKIDGQDFYDLTGYLDTNITTYSHAINANLSHNVCHYRVAIYDMNQVLQGYTNQVYLISTDTLSSPYDLEVTPVSSHEVKLVWKNPETPGVGTIVERKAEGESGWTVLATLGKDTTQFLSSGLTMDKVYYFRIKTIFNASLYSMPLESSGVTTKSDGPFDVTGSYVAPSHVLLNWSYGLSWNSNTVIDIERRKGNEDYALKFSTEAYQTSWVDNAVELNGFYTYRVKIRSKTDPSTVFYSKEVQVACVLLNSLFDLKAAAGASEINVYWKNNTDNATEFELWRKVGKEGEWEKYGEFSKDITTFKDTSIVPNREYGYKIRSHSSFGDVYSAFSYEVWVNTTSAGRNVGLNYKVNTPASVTFNWWYTVSDKEDYTIQFQRLSEPYIEWETLYTMKGDIINYTDTEVTPYEKYYYRLELVNVKNNSSVWSEEVTVTTGIPEAPTELELEQVAPNSVKLVWKDNSINEEGFVIEKRLPSYGTYVEVIKTGPNVTSYLERNLLPGVICYYRVKAVNPTGSSVYSYERYVVPTAPKTFEDIENVGWAREAIENLSSRGVIQGKTDTRFFPNDSMTRAEFVSLVIRSFQLSRTPVGYMADVKASDWYYQDIMTANALGIISGDNNYFYPEKPITREEMAVILCKVLKAVDKPLQGYDTGILDGYMDKDLIDPYAVSYMAALKGGKIMDGRSSTMLAPKDTATRAEAVVILYRVIDK